MVAAPRPNAQPPEEDRIPKPPYGVALMGDGGDDVSERSRVQVRPRFAVPMRPKMKPMDHWDLIVAYDGFMHQKEDDAFVKAGKAASTAKVKSTLDAQMEEVRAIQQAEQDGRRQERDNMLAMVQENKRLKEAEEHQEEDRKNEMKKVTDEMLAGIERRRQNEKDRKKREEQMMTTWLGDEKKRQQEEDRQKAEEHHRKCKAAQDEMRAAMEEAARKKKEQEAAEKTYIAEQQKGMDDKAAANRAAVQERMDQIERNCSTLGAEIAGRDAKAEQELQESIKRTQELGDRRAKEDAERRKSKHDRLTAEMVAMLRIQCQQREEGKARDKVEGVKQAKIFQEQYKEGVQKDNAKAEARKQARADLDVTLIDQMRSQLEVHPRNFLVTGPTQQTDVCYNRLLFEHMHKQGFMTDLTSKMLQHGPHRGKITPFPSVGPYEGSIHPDELMEPEAGC